MWISHEQADDQPSPESFLRGSDGGARVLAVWPDLMDAVAVFSRCAQTVAAGMAVIWFGIPAAEIRAALTVVRVPRADWPQVSADVSAMGRIAAEGRNQRAAK